MATNRTNDLPRVPEPAGLGLQPVEVSVCIVTYKARDLLRDCLSSVWENTHQATLEVVVVDNGSHDSVAEMLAQEFPQVILIENPGNAGFTRPINQALHAARGDNLLMLNPDTLVLPGAIDRLLSFLSIHPEAGICGPKVLNRDLSLQKACRRGESRPLAVLSYFLGLSRLFPKSKHFGEYLLTYLDEDEVHEVAGVAGSCMLVRREVIDQIGIFDERFFAYQEDADLCFRARQAGWKVYYVPEARIIHFGGQGGSRVEPWRSIWEWHRSYFLYYRKNLARDYFFLFNGFYYLAMALKLVLALATNLFRRERFAGPQR